MIEMLKSQIADLKNMPSESLADAQALGRAVFSEIARNLRVTGWMVKSCQTCNNVELYAPYDGPQVLESPANLGSCLFRAQFPACYATAESDYLNYIEENGIPIRKAMSLLDINSLLSLPHLNTTE